MACYHPIRAFRPEPGSASRKLIFSKLELAHLEPLKVPCGQCIGCRLDRSRQWAIRCVHEASLYERNSFITLTYSPDHLPRNRSLDKRHFQLFMKRLRKKFGQGVRYFHCGEYGEKNGRPHYHACLFNLGFSDRRVFTVRGGVVLYTSDTLSELWGKGFCTVGDVTFESAAYVARYITKKVTGKGAEAHYRVADAVSGEVLELCPEYTTMSRRPGIGAPWLKRYMSDVYPHDRVVLVGPESVRTLRPPKYYDSLFELEDPQALEEIKFQRFERAKQTQSDCTPERLAVRERHQYLRFLKLKRGYEHA